MASRKLRTERLRRRRLPTHCRYTDRGGLVRPAFDLYTTAGSPILEHEIKSMQTDDRSHQTQPQSGSRSLPTPIGGIEPTQHLGEIGRCDTRAAVDDANRRPVAPFSQAHFDPPVARGEFDRIVEEIRDGLEQQV